MAEAREQLQAERLSSRHTVSEERKCLADRADRMRSERDSMDARLEEERMKSAELLLQVLLYTREILCVVYCAALFDQVS